MLVQDVRSSIPIVSGESSLHASLSGMGLGRKGELKFIKKTARFLEGEKIDLLVGKRSHIFPGQVFSFFFSSDLVSNLSTSINS